MSIDGEKMFPITQQGGNSNASVSSDGSFIAFNSIRDGDWEIYVMDGNGNDQKRLTENSEQLESFPFSVIDGQPEISPTNDIIAFTSGRSGSFVIYLMTVEVKNLIV